MARPGPKSKKGKAAPKSKKVEEKEPDVRSDEEMEKDDEQPENGANNEEVESETDEPPAKRGRPGKGSKGKKPAAKKAPAKGKKSAKEESEEEEDDKEYEVDRIIEERTKKGSKEYLVKWKGYSIKDATWEPEDNLNCDEAMDEYKRKKAEPAKELREDRKKTDRYLPAELHRGKRHSRRNQNSPRKTYQDQDSD